MICPKYVKLLFPCCFSDDSWVCALTKTAFVSAETDNSSSTHLLLEIHSHFLAVHPIALLEPLVYHLDAAALEVWAGHVFRHLAGVVRGIAAEGFMSVDQLTSTALHVTRVGWRRE